MPQIFLIVHQAFLSRTTIFCPFALIVFFISIYSDLPGKYIDTQIYFYAIPYRYRISILFYWQIVVAVIGEHIVVDDSCFPETEYSTVIKIFIHFHKFTVGIIGRKSQFLIDIRNIKGIEPGVYLIVCLDPKADDIVDQTVLYGKVHSFYTSLRLGCIGEYQFDTQIFHHHAELRRAVVIFIITEYRMFIGV